MKQLVELGAVRIGAAIQSICTNVDIDVLSLPGGSLIAVVLWLYAGAAGSLRRRARRFAPPGPPSAAGGLVASVRRHSLVGKLLDGLGAFREMRKAHAAQYVRCLRELDVVVADDLDAIAPRVVEIEERPGQHLDAGLCQCAANGLLVVDHQAEVAAIVGRLALSLLKREELVAQVDEGHVLVLSAELEIEDACIEGECLARCRPLRARHG